MTFENSPRFRNRISVMVGHTIRKSFCSVSSLCSQCLGGEKNFRLGLGVEFLLLSIE